MAFYVSRKAGSVMFRAPHRIQVLAGQRIPDAVWDAVDQSNQRVLLREGAVVESRDEARVEAPEEQLPRVGVGQHEFSPEAHVQPGERVDAKLEALKQEQAARAKKAKDESEVDEDRGGSADGVVKIERIEDDEDEDDDLTEEERLAIEEMEAEDD